MPATEKSTEESLDTFINLLHEVYRSGVTRADEEVHRGTGFIQVPDLASLARAMHHLIQEGHIKEGERFLEMGSGNGVVCAIAAKLGLQATGVERSKGLVERSKELYSQMQKRIEIPGSAVFKRGNYFPQKFRTKFKKRIRDYLLPYLFTSKREKHPRNFSFGAFDVYYAFVWPNQIRPVLECFAKYAPHDARIILLGNLTTPGVRTAMAQHGISYAYQSADKKMGGFLHKQNTPLYNPAQNI